MWKKEEEGNETKKKKFKINKLKRINKWINTEIMIAIR